MGLNWGHRPLGLEVGKVFAKMLKSADQGRSGEGGMSWESRAVPSGLIVTCFLAITESESVSFSVLSNFLGPLGL